MVAGMSLAERVLSMDALQQPEWPDDGVLKIVRERLGSLPSLVFPRECDALRSRMAQVAYGRAFMVQGGDCAEMFDEVTEPYVEAKIRTLLQMSTVLMYSSGLPVVKVGRIAGQYSKPRSSGMETVRGATLPAYRGDAVNGLQFTRESRAPDPTRMLDAYNASASTLNLIRGFMASGQANLRGAHEWNSDFVRASTVGRRFEQVVGEIERGLALVEAVGVSPQQLSIAEMHTSHEALLVDYETSMLREQQSGAKVYDSSAHMIWVGERTRALDGAHIELARGVSNPIGVKLGPTVEPGEVARMATLLNPLREPGRLTLICRMGCNEVRDRLPELVRAVEREGTPVAWVCDPMHGNTYKTGGGYKTRRFDDVLDEVHGFFDAHLNTGTWPGGIHVEFTGDDVTECVGGGEELSETTLRSRYETACDPRLNRSQSLELAFLVAKRLGDIRPAA